MKTIFLSVLVAALFLLSFVEKTFADNFSNLRKSHYTIQQDTVKYLEKVAAYKANYKGKILSIFAYLKHLPKLNILSFKT